MAYRPHEDTSEILQYCNTRSSRRPNKPRMCSLYVLVMMRRRFRGMESWKCPTASNRDLERIVMRAAAANNTHKRQPAIMHKVNRAAGWERAAEGYRAVPAACIPAFICAFERRYTHTPTHRRLHTDQYMHHNSIHPYTRWHRWLYLPRPRRRTPLTPLAWTKHPMLSCHPSSCAALCLELNEPRIEL
jgi:hypothetical protein